MVPVTRTTIDGRGPDSSMLALQTPESFQSAAAHDEHNLVKTPADVDFDDTIPLMQTTSQEATTVR